jgi:hypothetical protein
MKRAMTSLDDLIPGSKYFRWREALWLQTWSIFVYPPPIVEQNIIKTTSVMDQLRERFDKPILVTSFYRPAKYNEWKKPYGVDGAKGSAHTEGKAVDFKVITIPNDVVRAELEPFLEHYGIRMEQDDQRDRVHIDIMKVLPGHARYFKP